MPDTKITALTAIGANPINVATFPIPMVDLTDTSMAASGTTKKVTVNQILGAGGTATLASATITGDLTVRTNKLKVDSTGVAVGATSAAYLLDVRGTDTTFGFFSGLTKAVRFVGSASTSKIEGVDNTNASYQPLSIGGSALDFSLSGTTAMTLNSTGLGVGASPTGKLTIGTGAYAAGTLSGTSSLYSTVGQGLVVLADGLVVGTRTGGDRFMLDTSGNVGIGVVPSAWVAGAKALQFGAYGALAQSSSGNIELSFNSYNSGAGAYKYLQNDTASLYRASSVHSWFTATSGLAGNGISFGDAKMTLDASGNLLVGTTGLNGSWNTKLTLSNDSGTTKWAVGPYLGGVTNFLISAGASAGVYLNGTAATSWTSASDERLKDIIEPISDAIAKVGSLRAVIGKFKFDENNTRKPFLIAQDIQAVLPEAVDASNPEKLGVAYTDVIPLLVAAIKELTARIQTIETR